MTNTEAPAPLTFTDQESLEAWLKTRPREDSIALAARAALRAVPMLAGVMTADIKDPTATIILPIFRASSVTSLSRWGIDKLVTAAALSADSALSAALSARSAALSAALSARSAALSAARSAVWKTISTDATMLQAGKGEALIRTPLWPDGPPDPIADNWQTLKSALLAIDGEDWAVWTDWYENQLRGGPFDTPLERTIALIPNDIWKQGPKAANAEVRRIINEHANKGHNRKLPLTIDQTRKLIEQDRLGFSFEADGDHIALDASDDPSDTRIEQDLPMMRMRADQLCRAFAGANIDFQLDRRDEAQMFADIVNRDIAEIANQARTLLAISMGMANAYELNAVEIAKGTGTLTDAQHSAIRMFLTSSGPFVRLFPEARDMDSEREYHLGVEHRRALDIKLIEAITTHRIILDADAKILRAIDDIAKAMTSQSVKAANILDSSQTNLLRRVLLFAAGKAGIVGDAALKTMGVDIAKNLELGIKAVAFVKSMKDQLLAHIRTLPDDLRVPMQDVVEELDKMDT